MKLTRRLLTLAAASSFALAGGCVANAHASDLLSSPLLRLGLTRSQIARVQAAKSRDTTFNFATNESVSCARHNDCESVGIRTNVRFTRNGRAISTTTSYAEHWNGSRWSIQRVVNPTDASQLRSVSCYAPDSCIAVGFFAEGAKRSYRAVPLTERWNGVRWSQVAIAAPRSKQASTILEGVSCLPSGECTAVGDYASSRKSAMSSYAVQFNGADWSRLSSPKTPLSAVSCPAAGDCFALPVIGSRIFHEQNGQWTSESVPVPRHAGYVAFDSLSCGSPYDCVASGSFQRWVKAHGEWQGVPLIEQFDGISWQRMLLPTSIYDRFGVYSPFVSCSSFSRCVAVGFATQSGDQTLVLENGSWHRAAISGTDPAAISCPDSDYCVETTQNTTSPVSIKASAQSAIFNGLRWRTVAMPLPTFIPTT